MAMVNITNPAQLTNVSEIIDRFCDDLVTNRGWTDRRNFGSVGGDDIQRTVERPAANTVNGDDIIISLRRLETGGINTGIVSNMEMIPVAGTWDQARLPATITNITQATTATVTTSVAHNYANGDIVHISGVVGMVEINGLEAAISAVGATTFDISINTSAFTAYTSGGTAELGFRSLRDAPQSRAQNSYQPCRVNNFGNAGVGNYLQAWFLTPNDTGALSADQQYAYCIIETTSGFYRSFGFGEGIKLGSWDGGVFCVGNWVQDEGMTAQGEGSDNHYIGFFQTRRAQTSTFFGEPASNFVQLKENLFGIVPAGYTNDSNRGWMKASFGVTSGNIPGGRNGAFLPGWTIVGGTALKSSPSAFSGKAVRSPIRYWVHVTQDDITSDVVPLIEIPDVFATNIRDFNPGDVVLDDTERFLVVPVYTKLVRSNTTGNSGFLIRNPGLPAP